MIRFMLNSELNRLAWLCLHRAHIFLFLRTANAHGMIYSIQEVNALLRLTNHGADQLENSS